MGNKLSARHKEQIERAFKHFDTDGDDKIQFNELSAALRVSRADSLRLLGECDVDNDGEISKEEFFRLVEKKFAPVYKTLLEGTEKGEDVTLENMKAVYKKADVDVTDKEIEDYFNSMDRNKDSVVSFDEFIIGCFVDLAIKKKESK